MEITTSGNGTKRDLVTKTDVYIALITKSFIKNDSCVNEMRDAYAVKKPMIAIIEQGLKVPEQVSNIKWDKTFYWVDNSDIETIAIEIREMIEAGEFD